MLTGNDERVSIGQRISIYEGNRMLIFHALAAWRNRAKRTRRHSDPSVDSMKSSFVIRCGGIAHPVHALLVGESKPNLQARDSGWVSLVSQEKRERSAQSVL